MLLFFLETILRTDPIRVNIRVGIVLLMVLNVSRQEGAVLFHCGARKDRPLSGPITTPSGLRLTESVASPLVDRMLSEAVASPGMPPDWVDSYPACKPSCVETLGHLNQSGPVFCAAGHRRRHSDTDRAEADLTPLGI
ncbi:hypothetical protein [Microvirga alba]|uniref:Uncharacterized protein n=1 Tax=Microvirga alba TaxID=2791025 RepID=A0A931BWX7_9HYPH|nr:hypothetical protein [Microvirga alba]MBF9235345.1 hypothetical protein [Microvirga alba]